MVKETQDKIRKEVEEVSSRDGRTRFHRRFLQLWPGFVLPIMPLDLSTPVAVSAVRTLGQLRLLPFLLRLLLFIVGVSGMAALLEVERVLPAQRSDINKQTGSDERNIILRRFLAAPP